VEESRERRRASYKASSETFQDDTIAPDVRETLQALSSVSMTVSQPRGRGIRPVNFHNDAPMPKRARWAGSDEQVERMLKEISAACVVRTPWRK